MVFVRTLGFLVLLQMLCVGVSIAHPGTVVGNGCHDEKSTGVYHRQRPPKVNPDVTAVARKSRENLCHVKASSNYMSLKYFVGCKSMEACLASGGRRSK